MNTFGQRLANARKMRGMSQRALCAALDGQVTATAIAKYENGLMLPSSTVLIALGRALRVKLDYFFRPFTEADSHLTFSFRKKAGTRKGDVDGFEQIVMDANSRYREIEALLGIGSTFGLDYSNSTVETRQDAEAMARRFRYDMNLGMDAIAGAVDLMEAIGARVIETDGVKGLSGVSTMDGGTPVIVISRNMTAERKRFTLFHELGHILLCCDGHADKERMADAFAGEVLMPGERFKALIGESRRDMSLMELQAVQREWGISVDALMTKAAQLKVISQKRYEGYHKKKNAVPAFKAAVERSLYPEEHAGRFERLVYRALASDIITFSKAAALLDEPVETVRERLMLM